MSAYTNDAFVGVLLIANGLTLVAMVLQMVFKRLKLRIHASRLVKQGYSLHQYEIRSETDVDLNVSGGYLAKNGILVTGPGGSIVGGIKRKHINDPAFRLEIKD